MIIRAFIFLISLAFCVTQEPAHANEQNLAQSNTNINGYTILPGDLLHINVWKEEGLDKEVVVLPDGSITFPLVGTIHVTGMHPQLLQIKIGERLSKMIPDATVTVIVKAPLGHKVSVLGEVREPQDVLLRRRMGVMQALSQAGGLTPYAEGGEIIIIRTHENGKKEALEFPYERISRGRDLDEDVTLMPGDVIVVPPSTLF
jgi:polysaccharide export outer membrane protein